MGTKCRVIEPMEDILVAFRRRKWIHAVKRRADLEFNGESKAGNTLKTRKEKTRKP